MPSFEYLPFKSLLGTVIISILSTSAVRVHREGGNPSPPKQSCYFFCNGSVFLCLNYHIKRFLIPIKN